MARKLISARLADDLPDHVTLEMDDGTALNANMSLIVNPAPPPVQGAVTQDFALRAGICYAFKKGDILPTHNHATIGWHNIQLFDGSVIVRKPSGDVTMTEPMSIVTVGKDEPHSIEGLADISHTLHWAVK